MKVIEIYGYCKIITKNFVNSFTKYLFAKVTYCFLKNNINNRFGMLLNIKNYAYFEVNE